jgi:hypothetical protein
MIYSIVAIKVWRQLPSLPSPAILVEESFQKGWGTHNQQKDINGYQARGTPLWDNINDFHTSSKILVLGHPTLDPLANFLPKSNLFCWGFILARLSSNKVCSKFKEGINKIK